MSQNSKNKNSSGVVRACDTSLRGLLRPWQSQLSKETRLLRFARNDDHQLSCYGTIAVILCCLLLAGPAWAGTAWLQKQKLTASDGAAFDSFGCSVSISGDLAIVGADWDNDNGDYSGSAYIFKRDGESWGQQQKLTASDGAAGDCFGVSVSISGDYAIVGAPYSYGNASYSGSAYIFRWNGTGWVQQQKLTASDGDVWDRFGYSVSISGDYAIVGSAYDDDKGIWSGSAYIFKRDGTSWVQQKKLTASDGAAEDWFGYSVSISGDYAIVGAWLSAYIFKRDGEIWSQQAKLLASDGAVDDYFGWSVSISGDLAIVGARYDDANGIDAGSAYIFRWDGAGWVQQQKLAASDGVAGDQFGESVSISGNKTIVGACYGNGNIPNSGSAYIFRWDGISWSQQQKLTASDGAAGDWFGYSVSISGDYAIVGAWCDGVYTGSAYIFIPCADWLTGDLYGDCFVDFKDFSILGNQWFQAPGVPSADLAPPGGDGVVNFLDLDILVNQWLKCGNPCDPNCQP